MPGTPTATAPRLTERRGFRLSGDALVRATRVADLVAGGLGIGKPVVFVSGFWRSGTTWLQELLADSLCAKTVFEPLSPQNRAWHRHLVAKGVSDWGLQEAFIPGRTDPNDPMWTYLDAAFHGTATSRLSVKCRSAVSESFRRAIVVKDVRLQLNLETIHRRYGVSVVHQRRHPCAVTSSLMSVTWPWSFDRVRMERLVAPFIGDLRAEGPPGIDAALAAFDGDMVSRIAAFWALTERLTARSLRDRPWAIILRYEDAVQDPAGAIRAVCTLVGRRPSRVADPNRDSMTTYGASRGMPSERRAQAWRDRLSTADIDRVHRVVAAIFPEALAGLSDRAA